MTDKDLADIRDALAECGCATVCDGWGCGTVRPLLRHIDAQAAEVARLQAIIDGMAARIAAQSELLSRRAELRGDAAPSVPVAPALRPLVLTTDQAEAIRQAMDDPNRQTHEGREMPTAGPQAFTPVIDTDEQEGDEC